MLGGNGPNLKSDRLLTTSLTTASLDYRYTRAHKASNNRHFDRFDRQTTLSPPRPFKQQPWQIYSYGYLDNETKQ